jgi:hypothetical protein
VKATFFESLARAAGAEVISAQLLFEQLFTVNDADAPLYLLF